MLVIFLELNSIGLYLSSEKKRKSILCSRQNERRERENEKWDQNKELKMKLLIGLRFMFGFVPIFHLPVNRARLDGHGCCFVFSVNLLLFLPFSSPCVLAFVFAFA